MSRRWLYNIPRSLETRGYRPLGRVALVDHSQRVRDLIDQKLQQLGTLAGSTDVAGEARDGTIKVVILAGTGGGTGAGMAIDVANAAKSLAATRGLQVEVHGFFVCTCFASNNSSPLVAANTYSLLTELNHATALGNESTGEADGEPNCSNRAKRHSTVFIGCQLILVLVAQTRLMLSARRPSTLIWNGCPKRERCFARAAYRRLRGSSRAADHSLLGRRVTLH